MVTPPLAFTIMLCFSRYREYTSTPRAESKLTDNYRIAPEINYRNVQRWKTAEYIAEFSQKLKLRNMPNRKLFEEHYIVMLGRTLLNSLKNETSLKKKKAPYAIVVA